MRFKQMLTQMLSVAGSSYSIRTVLLRWIYSLFIGFSILTGHQKVYAGEPGTYQNEGLRLIKTIHMIQIRYGVCTDLQRDCVTKHIAFFGRSSSGIDVEIFNTSNPKLIKDIFSASLEEFELNHQKMDITLSIYNQPHEQMMGFAKFYKKPMIRTFFKGIKP